MNLYSGSGSSARFYAVRLVIAAILFCASISSAFGQQRSTDRNNPTLLTSNEISDDLDGSGDEYFCKFSVGAGKLTVAFQVQAAGANAGATLDLFDANSRPLLSDVLAQGVDGGGDFVVKSIQLNRSRDVLLRIKGIKYGDSGGNGTYKVKLSGPVTFAPGAAPNGGAAAPAGPNLFTGELDGTENLLLHGVSVTGPGTVKFTFSVKATDTNAGATFEVRVQDSKAKAILSNVLVQGVDGGSDLVTKSITFAKAQNLVILVKGIKYGDNGGHGVYNVQVTGPVELAK
jgi:hypothetical protein